MEIAILLFALFLPASGFGQLLSEGLTGQDLVDAADGRLSRSTDNGRSFVPVRRPNPRDKSAKILVDYDAELCRKLARSEITARQVTELHNQKSSRLAEEWRLEQQASETQLNVEPASNEPAPAAKDSSRPRPSIIDPLLLKQTEKDRGNIVYRKDPSKLKQDAGKKPKEPVGDAPSGPVKCLNAPSLILC